MCSLHLTHPSAHTHTLGAVDTHTHTHTHLEQWTHTHTLGEVGSQLCSARGAVGGSVPCSRVSPQSSTSSPLAAPTSSPPAAAHFSTQGSGSPITARSAIPCYQESCRAHRNSFKESCLVHGDWSGQAAPLVMAIPRRLLLLSWRWKDPVRAPDFTSCPEWTSASMLKPGRSSCSCGLSCSCV